jgi:Bacterial transglutaminase-like cysteine proteinase BTLCP
MPAITGLGTFRRLVSPVLRFAARLVRRESLWDRLAIRVPPNVFGPGSRQPFADYFQGASSVPVKSIDDIVAWLQTCEYVTDLDLFHERDVWQHPGSFETLRRGDCEDFALWAWRKLAEIGIDAEFVVGRVVCDDSPEIDRQHAWVVYRVDGTAFLFEPAARNPSRIIRRLADTMDEYVPHFAVNHRFDTDTFVGCAVDSHRASFDCRSPAATV